VIVHQMTALADMRSLRKPDKRFAVTNELHAGAGSATLGVDDFDADLAAIGNRD
jgi:hypothetical protein